VFEPQALLLDEPLSALDAGLRVEMRDEIRALQRDHGIATLHITHDQEEALSIADRVAVMQAGRIAQIDVPRTLYDSPVNRAVATFVGQGNLWESRVTGPREVETPVGRLVTGRLEAAEGLKITVLVRPEQVRVGPAPDGVNSLSGTVSRDRFLGSVRRFDFATAGATLLGETSQGGDISVVHIPPAAIRVLPADK